MLKVSICTPTTGDRSEFNERIQRIAKSQDYPNTEHIMCYDNATIGTKRNVLCSQATGDIIVMFDSDDIYASNYVSNCVKTLEHCDTTGVNRIHFTDGIHVWLYNYTGKPPYVCGSGMAFYKRIWEHNPFRNTSMGEDNDFCKRAGLIIPMTTGVIATIHGGNTASHKQLHHMKLQTPDVAKNILESANKIITI